MKSELIRQLKTIPAFNALHRGFRKNFRSENFYFAHFMPETSDSAVSKEQTAGSALLNDNSGYFSEFVHEDELREDVTEFIRFIFKELNR